MTNTTKQKRRLSNSTVTGIVFLVFVNAVFIGVANLVSRYIKIYPKYFIMGIGSALAIVILINLTFIFGYIFKKSGFRKLLMFLSCVFLLVGGAAMYYLYKTNSIIDQIIDTKGKENVSYVLLALNPNDALDDLHQQKIGYVATDDSFEPFLNDAMKGYNLNQTYKAYHSVSEMVYDAIAGGVKYVILPKDYDKISQSLNIESNPFDKAKTLLTLNKNVDDDVTNVDVTKEPFTVLMMGNNEGLSDSIILASYNPTTQRVTMTSIPRDSYVPIACQGGRRDKVNHSRAISRKCFIDSIENYVGVNVDFYFETDFYAIIKIVDALGGLEITSPVSFAGTYTLENSKEERDVYIEKGTHVLNGEQVLTFARERHHMPSGDYDRQMNQQYVIKEIVTKILATRNPNTFIEVLDGAKANITTNLSMDAISSLIGHAFQVIGTSPLSTMDAFRIESTQILGASDFTPGGMWIMWPYVNDIKNAHTLTLNNLETKRPLNQEKAFSFSYRRPYSYVNDRNIFLRATEEAWKSGTLQFSNVKPVASSSQNSTQKPTNSGSVSGSTSAQADKVKVPSFAQMTNEQILDWANKNDITVRFKDFVTGDAKFTNGQFWYQNPDKDAMIDRKSTVEVHRVKKS